MSSDEYTTNLHVHFTPLPDNRDYGGVLVVYKPDSFTFLTRKELHMGQEIMLSVCLVEEHNNQCSPKRPARVESVEHKNGIYRVKAKHEDQVVDDIANRRGENRYSVTIPAECETERGHQHFEVQITDLSKVGLGLRSKRRLSVGEYLRVKAKPSAQAGAASHRLQAEVTVMRSRHVGDGQYDIGTRFIKAEVLDSEDPLPDVSTATR